MSNLTSLLKSVTSPAGNPRGQSMTFELEVVTPMFLAGARNKAANDRDQPGRPTDIEHEFMRPTSIKSLLRWWWRAVASHTHPTELHAAEGLIFGDTKAS